MGFHVTFGGSNPKPRTLEPNISEKEVAAFHDEPVAVPSVPKAGLTLNPKPPNP